MASANSMTDLEAAVNSDLENARKWLIANKLSLNVAKTEFILIGSKSIIKNISNSHLNVFIENKKIKQVYECKTLGVKIDQHLSWKGNTDEICKKVTAGISAIRRIKPFVDQDTLTLIYNAKLFIRTSTSALKHRVYLVKLNQNDCKNCKIEQLELF